MRRGKQPARTRLQYSGDLRIQCRQIRDECHGPEGRKCQIKRIRGKRQLRRIGGNKRGSRRFDSCGQFDPFPDHPCRHIDTDGLRSERGKVAGALAEPAPDLNDPHAGKHARVTEPANISLIPTLRPPDQSVDG